jgi:hypothetical protein
MDPRDIHAYGEYMPGVKSEKIQKILSSLTEQGKRFFPFEKFSQSALTLVVSLSPETLKIGHGRAAHGNFVIEGVAVEDVTKKTDA